MYKQFIFTESTYWSLEVYWVSSCGLHFFDIEKCLDRLENCINALWDNCVKDDTLSLRLYLLYEKGSQDWIYIFFFNVIDFYVKHSSPSFKNPSSYILLRSSSVFR